MRFRHLTAFCALMLLAWPALGQEQSGSIEGVVKDSSGAVVPGAAVEVRSPNLVGAASTTTDAAGGYRFPALPPGRYEVIATLPKFAPAKVANVDLALGQVRTVNLVMRLGGMTEELQVIGEAPLIDVKQSARFYSIRDELVNKIPRGRDFTTLVTQAPGVNSESKLGGISIDGASAGENRYIIDGAETTALVSGLSGKALITDFVEEVQVKSSGYTAEYGGSTGGVINVITKSGSNQWRGSVGAYLFADYLEGDERPTLRRQLTDITKAEYVTFPKEEFTRLEPGFTLGGPLMRDRLWFFTSYQPALISTDRTVTFRSNNATSTFNEDVKIHYSLTNLTAQLSNRARARIAFNINPSRTEGVLPARDGSGNPAANYGIITKRPNYTLSGNLDYTAASNLYFSLRGGHFSRDVHQENVFEGARFSFSGSNNLPGVPPELQRVSGFSNVPSNSATIKDKQTRLSLQVDGSYFVSAGGQHAFKAGVQFDRIGNAVESGETGNLVTLFWNQNTGGQRGQFGYYTVRSNGVNPRRGFITEGNIHSNNVGLFIQDSWTIKSRLTLNLGLRSESEYIPSFADPSLNLPETAIKFSFADKIAPRAGFAWDVKGDGRWKVYGSWGIFYDITKLEMPRGSFGGEKWLQYWYSLDTPDWPNLVSSANCPPACPGRLLQGPIDFRHPSNSPDANTIDPDLEPFKLQEYVAGIEHELTKVLSVSVRYVHKQIDKAIEDVGSLDAQQNEIYTIGNPGFGQAAQTGFGPAFPKAVRDYDAVELTLNRRLSNNWSARVSYLWSRLYGNYSGLSQSDENGRTSPNVGRNFDYPIMAFDQRTQPVYGILATDRPHQFKTQALYDFDFGTSLGLNVYVASGIPISREARFIPGNNFPVQYLGRNSDGRTPTYSQFDLYAQHEIRLGGNKRLQLSVNVLNLFDQDTVTNRFPTQTAASIRITPQEFYRGFDTQALLAAQRIQLDPRFLMDSAFQGSRQIRFGVKFTF